MSETFRTDHPNRPSLRRRLLAGVAVLSALGVAVPLIADLKPTPAFAETQGMVQTMPSFADIVEKVRPAVVSVKVKVESAADTGEDGGGMMIPDLPPGHPLEKFFKQFREGRGGHKGGPKQFGLSQGSGFFISADGYAVTNNHVIENAVTVTLTTDTVKRWMQKSSDVIQRRISPCSKLSNPEISPSCRLRRLPRASVIG